MNDWKNYDYLSLSTQKRDGSWVDTPIWFAYDGDQFLYGFSEKKAGKIKRLKNFSQVRINPCGLTGNVLGQWHDAQAQILSSEQDIQQAYDTLVACYGWKMRTLNVVSRLAGKINNRAFIKISLDNKKPSP